MVMELLMRPVTIPTEDFSHNPWIKTEYPTCAVAGYSFYVYSFINSTIVVIASVCVEASIARI